MEFGGRRRIFFRGSLTADHCRIPGSQAGWRHLPSPGESVTCSFYPSNIRVYCSSRSSKFIPRVTLTPEHERNQTNHHTSSQLTRPGTILVRGGITCESFLYLFIYFTQLCLCFVYFLFFVSNRRSWSCLSLRMFSIKYLSDVCCESVDSAGEWRFILTLTPRGQMKTRQVQTLESQLETEGLIPKNKGNQYYKPLAASTLQPLNNITAPVQSVGWRNDKNWQ